MKKAVFGIAKTEEQAVRIANNLKAAGFADNDISAIFPDKQGSRDFAHEQHTKAPEGAVSGAVAGGVLGGGLGWLVGIGSLAIPGLGPFIAAGPILAALSGAAAGGTVGGITGGLIGLGIPEYEAKQYEGKLRDGNILMSVHAEDSAEVSRAKDIFKNEGAQDISYSGESSVSRSDRTETGETEPYPSYESGYRENFTSTYGRSGRQYTEYEPAYRYGHTLATDPRYRDRDWAIIEPEARRDWANQKKGSWEEFKDAIRYGWDRARGRRSADNPSWR
jgi:hypothetical protein